MDKSQAYNFFQDALSCKVIALTQTLDQTDPSSPQYNRLIIELEKTQTLLSHLGDIANAV